MKIRESLIKTLSYFDNFDHPLTVQELYKFLWKADGRDFGELFENLDEENIEGIKKQDSHYYLQGSEDSIRTRQRRVSFMEDKMKIAVRAAKKISWIPFLQGVFVCNTLAMGSADKGSDIDFFIVTKPGRIWLVRAIVTFVLSLFRLRRTNRRVEDKVCLSFYCSSDALDMSEVSIDQPDIYMIYWLSNLIPLYDNNDIQEKILKSNNWVENYTPNALQKYKQSHRWRVENEKIKSGIKKMLEKFWSGSYGDVVDNQAKEAQRMKMKMNFDTVKDKPDTRVVINDDMLKFHENDRREHYKKQWKQTYQKNFIRYEKFFNKIVS